MITVKKVQNIDSEFLAQLANLQMLSDEEAMSTVMEIVSEIARRGDPALMKFAEKFDRLKVREASDLRVDAEEIEQAYSDTSPELISAMKRAKHNIELYHQKTMPVSWQTDIDGTQVGQIVRPLKRIGAYVPGGRAAYPSTLLMTTVPAKVAGVIDIAVCCPPDESGHISKHTLAAAKIADITEIYSIGGAQAIAAMAYGTDTIKRVDKICGPGNIYVTMAKSLVVGAVGIDMLAGPSEVVIIGDDTAEPSFIAADICAQAEHDPKASAFLITTSEDLADNVIKELDLQIPTLNRGQTIRESLSANGRIFVVDTLDDACFISNHIAPEHLELCVKDPESLLDSIENAGAIFLGSYTPEALGDYLAGPNHVLPTAGTARFASPLGTADFMKCSSLLYCSKQTLKAAANDIAAIALAEDLDAHARSAMIRSEKITIEQ